MSALLRLNQSPTREKDKCRTRKAGNGVRFFGFPDRLKAGLEFDWHVHFPLRNESGELRPPRDLRLAEKKCAGTRFHDLHSCGSMQGCQMPFAQGGVVGAWKRPPRVFLPASKMQLSCYGSDAISPNHSIPVPRRAHDMIYQFLIYSIHSIEARLWPCLHSLASARYVESRNNGGYKTWVSRA